MIAAPGVCWGGWRRSRGCEFDFVVGYDLDCYPAIKAISLGASQAMHSVSIQVLCQVVGTAEIRVRIPSRPRGTWADKSNSSHPHHFRCFTLASASTVSGAEPKCTLAQSVVLTPMKAIQHPALTSFTTTCSDHSYLPFIRHTLQPITTNHPPIHHAHNPIQQPHNPPPTMGATLSCLANDVSIADYPHEGPLPARPVSQQQLSRRQIQVPRRQPLQLEYSSEHGNEVPTYRRQVAQRPRRESLPVDYEYGHEEDVARFPSVRSQRQRQQPQRRSSPQRGALQREASYDEEDDDDDDGEASVSPPHFPPHQLPRRSSLPPPHSYLYEYDSDILRHERRPRRQSTRPRYEFEALPAPVYGDGLPERRMRPDQGLRGRESGFGDAPPSYEDHVFDQEVREG